MWKKRHSSVDQSAEMLLWGHCKGFVAGFAVSSLPPSSVCAFLFPLFNSSSSILLSDQMSHGGGLWWQHSPCVCFFCVEAGHYYSPPESVDYAEVVIFCLYQMSLTKKKKKNLFKWKTSCDFTPCRQDNDLLLNTNDATATFQPISASFNSSMLLCAVVSHG